MALDPHQILQAGSSADDVAAAPLTGTRQQRLQRLQIGLLGLGGILLLVGLANIIISGARESEEVATPVIAAPGAEDLPEAAARDPLADAGVAPDLPVEGTSESATADSDSANDTQLVPID